MQIEKGLMNGHNLWEHRNSLEDENNTHQFAERLIENNISFNYH